MEIARRCGRAQPGARATQREGTTSAPKARLVAEAAAIAAGAATIAAGAPTIAAGATTSF